MPKLMQPINPPTLPKPAGYAHGWEVQGGKTVYIAGQVALDKDGHVVGKGDMVAQFRQVCENLRAILEAAGSSLDRVVKVTIYMVDLGEVLAMNEVFSQYFPVDPPARTTFECSRLIGNARVEIEAIAVVS